MSQYKKIVLRQIMRERQAAQSAEPRGKLYDKPMQDTVLTRSR
jgi:hypothetical protein